MSETVKWEDVEDPIERCFMEAREQAAAEAEERSWKRAMDIIDNPKYREQAIKASREESARQAKILEQGRIPTVYDDDYVGDDDYEDDDYDADEWYLDDECYPDDE